MKSGKFVVLSLLLVSLLLLTSCQDTGPVAVEGAFIGGTQGVVAEFEPFGVEDEGMYSLFDTETFPIEVTVRNKGEYKLQPGDVVVSLLGPSQEEFGGIPSWTLENFDEIDQISDLVPDGGEETITFSDEAKYENVVTGLSDRVWFANIDYNYETYVIIPEVCLKEDLTDDRVCDVKGTKDFFVSGAPVTVVSVEEETAGKGIVALRIGVENVAGGKVAKVGEEFEVADKLMYAIDDDAWECKSAGKVNEARLVSGKAEIICKLNQPLAEGTLSTKQVQLTLNYQYREIIQESLRIKQSAE